MRRAALLLALILAPAAVAEEDAPSRLTAAAWCEVQRGSGDDTARCDIGMGIGLWGRDLREGRRVSVVAMIGTETVGAGIAWTVGAGRAAVSVGVGVTVPYGEGGIDPAGWHPAVGATWGW